MIQQSLFDDIQKKIIKRNEDSVPSTPESLFLTHKTDNQGRSLSFDIIIEKGGKWVRQAAAFGNDVVNSDASKQVGGMLKDVANSETVADVMKADLVKQALAGAAFGGFVVMALPFSFVGLGTGAAVGASLAGWRYFTK